MIFKLEARKEKESMGKQILGLQKLQDSLQQEAEEDAAQLIKVHSTHLSTALSPNQNLFRWRSVARSQNPKIVEPRSVISLRAA